MAGIAAKAAPFGAATIGHAVLSAIRADTGQATSKVSTEELRRILADGSALVLVAAVSGKQ